jgi:hypothetical protein
MLLTTADIYAAFQALYMERSSRYFDQNWALAAMNEAVRDIATELGVSNPEFFGVKTALLGYVANQQEYDLPQDFIRANEVFVTDLGGPPYRRLLELQPHQRHVRDAGGLLSIPPAGFGEPEFYYIYGPQPMSGIHKSKLGFVPIPTRTATDNVTVTYYAMRSKATAIDDSTYLDLPPDWYGLVPYKMAVLAAAVDNPGLVAFYGGLYNSHLERLLLSAVRGRGEAQETHEVIEGDDWWGG